MATRKAAGGIVVIPVKAATTIAMNGLVCVDATGYAVAGGDTAALKFVGIAAQGVANAGLDGAKTIKVWTEGVFKITTAGGAVTDQGKTVYATGAATVADTSTNGIEVGKCVQYVSATSIWVQINQAAGDVSAASITDGSVTESKLDTGAVTENKIGALAVTSGKIGAGAVTLAKIATAAQPILHTVAAGIMTTSREDNTGALAKAIVLANELNADLAAHGIDVGEHTAAQDDTSFPDIAAAFTMANSLKSKMNAHAADATEHTTAIDNVNFPVATADATSLATLIALVSALQDKYVLHDDDAELSAAWVFHAAKETGNHSLTSAAHPTTFGECLTRLADLQAAFNAHDADTAAHGTDSLHQDSSPGFSFQATDYVTMMSIATAVLAQYDVHDADAELGVPVFHAATEAGDHSLVSAVAPSTLAEALTRLNDLKTKYNAHDADGTAHGTDTQHQIVAPDVAYGTTIRPAVAGAQVGDTVTMAILNDGSGNVTGVSGAVTVAGYIDLTFSADPQNDAIVAYQVYRAAA